MWQCSTCKREFLKTRQAHSCRPYPIENHFEGKKEVGKVLFEKFVKAIEKNIGPIKIESLECCIHLVSSYTFGGVWVLKDRIRMDFRLDKALKDKRISKFAKISANRYIYYFEITEEKQIDEKFLGWIKEAYFLNKTPANN